MVSRSRFFSTILSCAAAMTLSASMAAEPKNDFATSTIDVGVVVSNLGKSAKFYTEALGLKELPGFAVPADFCADAGLTDHQPLAIRVFALGDGDTATKIKLMEVPGVTSKKSDNTFIHSQLGNRYLTIRVTDTAAALARLKKAGVQPIAKGPVPLPAGLPAGMVLIVVRDPDGNPVELVGPKPGA